MHVANDSFGCPVGDFDYAVVDFGCARDIKGVCVEVERTGLKRSLEDVRDVGKQDVVE